MSKKKLAVIIGTSAYILFLLACVLGYAVEYITEVIQVESFSQFLYTMQVGMGGAGNTIVQILQGFLKSYAVLIILATLLYATLLRTLLTVRHKRPVLRRGRLSSKALVTLNCGCLLAAAGSVFSFAGELSDGYSALKIDRYLEEQNTYSSLYESHYVKPNVHLLDGQAQGKNLIYIYMESMESTFTDKAHGGGFDVNLIPNLTRLAQENVNFTASDSIRLNGGQVTNQTSWTVAGMVAQTSGTPLGVSNSQYNHTFSDEMYFLPEVVSLGDLLDAQGYTNMLMCGSQASYAGRSNYFRQHGNYEIFDVETARADGHIPENYNVWWGFEDSKLIDFAKEEITRLAGQKQPFNFTMLTADTHFKDGYRCDDCPETQDEQYENVILCSDKRVAEFVSWIQEQPFYEDTVIILAGDHLSMDSLISQSVGIDFPRRTYFTVINGPAYTQEIERQFTTLDIFPTTVEALGYQIEGHRLGLGTSLYSAEPTLTESMGFDELNAQIAYRNKRYEEEILKNDGYSPDDDQNSFFPSFTFEIGSSTEENGQIPLLPVFDD